MELEELEDTVEVIGMFILAPHYLFGEQLAVLFAENASLDFYKFSLFCLALDRPTYSAILIHRRQQVHHSVKMS